MARTKMRAVGACAGVLVVAALALSGCAPEPGPQPTASASSPAPSESPSPTPTMSTPGSPTPTPSGPPATRPVEPPTETDPDAQGMTAEQAGQLCAAEHRSGQGAGDAQVGEPTAYERTVQPRWYVTILAENEFGQYYQECILGGPADAPEWSLAQGTPAEQMTKAYIEQRRTQNEESGDF